MTEVVPPDGPRAQGFVKGLWSFKGTMDRRSYIVAALIFYALFYAVAVLFYLGVSALGGPKALEDAETLSRGSPWGWLALMGAGSGLIVFLIGRVAISVRRLHDAGQSGFLVLLFAIIPFVLPDLPWPATLPPFADLVWNAIMIILPASRRRQA